MNYRYLANIILPVILEDKFLSLDVIALRSYISEPERGRRRWGAGRRSRPRCTPTAAGSGGSGGRRCSGSGVRWWSGVSRTSWRRGGCAGCTCGERQHHETVPDPDRGLEPGSGDAQEIQSGDSPEMENPGNGYRLSRVERRDLHWGGIFPGIRLDRGGDAGENDHLDSGFTFAEQLTSRAARYERSGFYHGLLVCGSLTFPRGAPSSIGILTTSLPARLRAIPNYLCPSR